MDRRQRPNPRHCLICHTCVNGIVQRRGPGDLRCAAGLKPDLLWNTCESYVRIFTALPKRLPAPERRRPPRK